MEVSKIGMRAHHLVEDAVLLDGAVCSVYVVVLGTVAETRTEMDGASFTRLVAAGGVIGVSALGFMERSSTGPDILEIIQVCYNIV